MRRSDNRTLENNSQPLSQIKIQLTSIYFSIDCRWYRFTLVGEMLQYPFLRCSCLVWSVVPLWPLQRKHSGSLWQQKRFRFGCPTLGLWWNQVNTLLLNRTSFEYHTAVPLCGDSIQVTSNAWWDRSHGTPLPGGPPSGRHPPRQTPSILRDTTGMHSCS